jgi:hypothetical protein
MDESRPLGKLAARLVTQFGYFVTYEDAPCDERELRTDVYPNGKRYRYPSWTPMSFNLHSRSDGITGESKPEARKLRRLSRGWFVNTMPPATPGASRLS